MLSVVHATVVELLEAHPDALSYLLSLEGPAPTAPLVPTTGTRSKTFTLERRVDRAYVLGSREKPQGFMLGEVQMDIDPDKVFAWALYVELARSRYRCEGALVVLTFGPAVRRWIERDIASPTGQNGSLRQLRPRVIAVDEIPSELLLRPEMPYLALLAVAAHLEAPDVKEIAETAIDITASHLPAHLAQEQLDGILGMVDASLQAHLENRIMEHREYKSNLFRRLKDEALQEGLATGKAEGLATGKAESVLRILAARGLAVSSRLRERVLHCTDLALLDSWLDAALVATSAAAAVSASTKSEPPAPRSRTGASKGASAPASATKPPAKSPALRTRRKALARPSA